MILGTMMCRGRDFIKFSEQKSRCANLVSRKSRCANKSYLDTPTKIIISQRPSQTNWVSKILGVTISGNRSCSCQQLGQFRVKLKLLKIE